MKPIAIEQQDRPLKQVWFEMAPPGPRGIWQFGIGVTRYGTLMFNFCRRTLIVGPHSPVSQYLKNQAMGRDFLDKAAKAAKPSERERPWG
jgi:hypothetical protein